jgi:hypothetical protein
LALTNFRIFGNFTFMEWKFKKLKT